MSSLSRYFTRLFSGRLAYLSALASVVLLLQMLCITDARAQQGSCPLNNSVCDQGTAYSMCMAQVSAGIALGFANGRCTDTAMSSGQRYYYCMMSRKDAPSTFDTNCSQPNAFYYRVNQSCASRNANKLADAAPWYSEPSSCIGGCAVQGTAFSGESGGVKTYGMRDRSYNGEVCNPSKVSNNIGEIDKDRQEQQKEQKSECTALGGGQTGCQKPNGDYCATASTGKTFCWKIDERGSKSDGQDGQTKQPKGEPVPVPDIKIEDKDWQRKEGHQQTACINTTCTTYNITNFSTVPNGSSKNSTGDNSKDGTGNSSGNGSTKGTGKDGEGESGGDSATDSGNCAAPPACTGDTLKCLHLKFTWKTQCNTTPGEVTKGDGCDAGDVPVCAGASCKAEQYAQLLQQWRARCTVEGLKKGVEEHAGQGDGDDGTGSIIIDDSGQNPSLDENKIAYSGGQLGYSFDVEGVKFEMPQQVIDFLPILRFLIIAGAAIAAIHIMRGS